MIVAKRQLRSLLLAGLLLLIGAGVLSAQTEISGSLDGVLQEDTYLAVDDIEVTMFNDLFIEPGTIIYFNQDVEFIVRGTLAAEGSAVDSILFLNAAGATWSGITFNGAFSDESYLGWCRVSGSDHRGIHIVNSDLTIENSVISGNTTNGFADLINHRGAGLYIYSGTPTITNSLIANNESVRGAGVYIWRDGNPSMTNTIIRDNDAIFNDQNEGGHGGGIYFYNCNPTVSNLTISGNYAQDNGGGIYCYTAHPTIQNCDISDNEADGGGGGIAMIQSQAQILSCEIYNNSTSLYGGGIHAFNACAPTIDKCLFRNNSANLRGGAIHAYSDGNPTITRNTIVFNTSPTGAGIYIGYNSDGTVNSNIVAFNIEGEGINATNDSPLSEIAYNNVHSNDAGGMWGNLPDGAGDISTVNENGDPCDVYYNIDEEPQFTDTFLNDYTLESTSPSIDAGDPDIPADPDLSIADQGAFPYYQHTPIAFDLLSPIDGSIVYVGGDTTLTWQASADPDGQAVRYNVWMGNSPDLSDAVQIADGLLATSFAVNDLEDDQDWYWTVHATDSNTSGMWARDTLHFHTHTVEPPGAFALVSPADESIQPSTGVTLRWTRSIDADPDDEITYTVQWSSNSNFLPLYQSTTQDTMLFINALQDITAEFPDNSTVYWRVRARDTFNQNTWATPQSGWSFDVVDPDPPAAFDLIGPEDMDTCWTGDTTFVWEATTDPDMGDEVTGYMLWVATNPSFTANLDSFFTTGTSYTVNNLQDDVEYWWMVRALDNNTNGRWSSEAWRLRIYIPEAPLAFNLSSPPNNGEVDNDTVTVVWHAPVDPDPNDQMTYTIEWTEDASWTNYYSDTTEELAYEISDLSQPLVAARRELAERYLSGELDLDNIGGLDELDELPDETWVYWRVRAMDSFGNSVQCTPAAGWRFYVNVTDPIEPFSLFSPGDGDTCWTGDTTFTWNHTQDPDGILLYYRFQWAEDEDFTINVDSTAATFDSFKVMNGFEDDHTYWWRVRAGNLAGSSRMSSETWALNIFIPEQPSAFDLLSPPNEDTLFISTPTVSWQASVDPDPGETVRYRVIWATDAGFTQNVDSSAATTSTSITLPVLNDDTTYWWRVRALDPRAGDVWSTSTRQFHIYIPEPPADFSYLAPVDGSVVEEDTITVSWNAAVDPDPDDVITYTVYWSTAANFSPLYTATTTETSYRISDLASVLGHGFDELDQLPDNQRVYWKVTAEDSYGFTSNGLPTTGWSFWTNYIDEPPDPFSLLSPANDDTVWAGDTTLTWQATTEPDPGDDVTGYVVWWATNSAFTDNLDSAAVGAGVTSYHLEDLIDDHAYWWKVRALDNNTNGRWSSDTRRFHAFVPDPPSAFALAAPDSGDLIAEDTVVVYWRQSTDPDLNDEITYTVMWSTDPGFGTVYSGTTQDTSYIITDLANLGPQEETNGGNELDELPDATTIYWRVRAEDRYNLSTIGTPSHGWSFTTNLPTPPQPFSLLSPSSGDTCWTGDTTLTWQTAIDPDPDDTVLRYVVWIATNSTFTQNLDSISVNAPATTLDLVDLDDDQVYYWKVRAQDGNTTGRWSSTTRYFRTYFPESPGAFALQSPANGADVANDTVTVSWTAAVDPDPNDVLTYTVEWSTQSNFATSYTGATTNTSFRITDLQDYVGDGNELDELPDDITIYWRVAVSDRFGNERQATPPEGWSFHIDIPQPPLPFSLVSPTNDVTCWTGDTTIVWRATTDPDPGQNVTYTIWWARNLSFTSLLDSATTADTSFEMTNLTDNRLYYWKVKAVDDDGNATWSSQTWRFWTYIPDPPVAFNLLSPADGDTCWTGDTTLTWEAATDPDPNDDLHYEVWWATNAGFTAGVDSQAVTGTSYGLTNLADNTQYWWRVKVVDSFGNSAWSTTTRSFHTYILEPPGAFTLVSPDSGDVIAEDTVTVTWTAAVDPDPNDEISYRVEWATNPLFAGYYSGTTEETTFDITDLADVVQDLDELEDDITVYWRVRAIDNYSMETLGTPGYGWSFSIYIPEAPSAFSLLSPDDGDTCWTGDTTLTWQASIDPDPDDVITYKVWWATNAAFTEGLDSASTNATSYALNNLPDDTRFFWKVRAQDQNSLGTWSTETWHFDVFIPDPPTAFNLLTPPDESVLAADTVTVTWSASSDPDPGDEITYRVEWATNPAFTGYYSGTTLGTTFDITDLADVVQELDELPDDITVYWRVRAMDKYDLETLATPNEGWSFSIYIPEPPTAFNLLSPSDGDTCWTGDTTLTWEASSDPDPGDAITYKVWWATNAAFTQGLDSASTIATSYALNNLPDDTRFYWKVRAQDTNTTGTWSTETWHFDVFIPDAPTAFNLLTPPDESVLAMDTVTVTWEASTDADPGDEITYRVEWATNPAFTGYYSGTTLGTTFDITDLADVVQDLDELPDDITVFWRVRAMDKYDQETLATPNEGWSFSIFIPEPPSAFSLLSPDDGDTCWTGDTTLTWEASSDPDPGDAITYKVWWATNAAFTEGLDSASTAETSYELNNLPDDTRFWWKVRAQDTNTSGTWSTETWQFDVFIPETPDAFNLTGPVTGDTCWTGDTTLVWQASSDNDPGDVITYKVWWATNAAFTEGLDSASTSETTYALNGLDDDTRYWWKVRAQDRYTNGTWSNQVYDFDVFIIEAPGPFSLVAPTNGAEVNDDTVTVSWTQSIDPDANDIVTYRVEWSTSSTFAPLYDDETTETSYNITGLVDILQDLDELPDDVTVYWRVRAIDRYGFATMATPSDGWSFTVRIPEPPAAFSLIGPVNGDTCWTGDTTFTWQASVDPDPGDAIIYKVYWATNAAFTEGLDSVMTNGTSYGVTNLTDDSHYWWKVLAQDSNTNGTWSTQTESFEVYIPEAPGAFALTYPPNEASMPNDTVTVEWVASVDPDPDDAVTYRVEWSTSDTFVPLYDDETNATSYQITDLADVLQDLDEIPDNTTVYWRVRAIDRRGMVTWATPNEGWSFTIRISDAPFPFSLLDPLDGDTCWTGDTTLTWQVAADPDPGDEIAYKVWWATNATFTEGLDSASVTETSYDLNGLNDDTNYWWKVRAQDNNSSGTWSTETRRLHVYIPEPPSIFSLIEPEHEDTVWTSAAELSWQAANDNDPNDTIEYWVFWANDPGFTTGLDSAVVNETSYTLTGLMDDHTYYWKVRAQDNYTGGTWSTQTRMFHVYMVGFPNAFSLISPLNGDTCWTGDTTLVWHETTDPDPDDDITYVIWWANNEAFTEGLDSTTTTDTTLSLENLSDDTPYWWKVRAQDQNSAGTWSTQTLGFHVYIPESPVTFGLALPENEATVTTDTVTIFWHPATDPDPGDVIHYDIELAMLPDFSHTQETSTSDTSFIITDYILQMAGELDELEDDQTYYWRVFAEDRFGNNIGCTPITGYEFTVHVPEAPEAFSLISPIDEDICWTGDTTLVWHASSDPDPGDVITYHIWIANDEQFTIGLDSMATPDTTLELIDLPDDTPFWWKVRAQDMNTEGTWSTETGMFEVFIPEAPAAFSLLSPLNGVTLEDVDVGLDWQESSDNDPDDDLEYVLYWSLSENFVTGVDSVTLTDTEYTLLGLSDDTQYWWKVRAQDNYTEGTWSTQTWSFSVGVPQSPFPFSLISPAEGDTIWSSEGDFFWHGTSDPDPEEDFTYHFQTATDPLFTLNFVEQVLDADTGAVAWDLMDDTRYWWRVVAIDELGHATYSNETWYFDVYIPEAPDEFSLLLPENEAIIEDDTVMVYWETATDPDPGDWVSYTVQWSMFPIFPEYASATTLDTMLSINGLADQILAELDELPDDVSIYWRVVAVDQYGDSTWATPETGYVFHVSYENSPPLAFDLAEPADGDTVFTGEPIVRWETAFEPDPGDSVASYTIVWAEDEAFTVGVDSTTGLEDTSYVFEGLTDETMYWWKVRAVDTNTNGTWSTSTFRFLVYIPEPPTAFNLLSPEDETLVAEDTVRVTWSSSSDPDAGDTLTYHVIWSIDPEFTITSDSLVTDTTIQIGYVDMPMAQVQRHSTAPAGFGSQSRKSRNTDFGESIGLQKQTELDELDELDELFDGITVYWKVVCSDEYGNTVWGEPEAGWSFTVNLPSPPDTFSLHEPLNSDTVWTDSTQLVWFLANEPDPDDEITDYVVWWATDEDFTENLDSAVVTLFNTYWLYNLTDDTRYWWKVRANDGNSDGRWCNEAFDFRVYIPEPPTAPELISPDNETISTESVVLQWTGSTDPDPNDEIRYVVVWSHSQDFLEIDSTVTTETTATLHDLADDSDYWWHVRAQDRYTEGTWSDTIFTFSLSIPEPPTAFQLYGPDNEATLSDSAVTLAWQTATDPDPGDEVDYELAISWNAAFTPAAYFSLTDTTYLLDGIDDLPALPGMMQVESKQQELGVANKGKRNAQTTRSNSGPTSFGSVGFTSNGANSLRVASLDDSIPLPDDATIYWKVVALDQDNQRTTGTPANGKSFSLYYPDPPEAFNLLEPANGASLPFGNVTLRWEETTDPDPGDELTYVVGWSLDMDVFEDFDSVVVSEPTATIGGLMGNTTYYWRVRAQDSNTHGTWSDDIFHFSLEEDNPPTAFSLLSPQDEDTIYSRSLTLDWEESEDPDNFGISYVIWLSNDEYFQDHVDSIFTDTTGFTLSNLQDEVDYWWAVRAIDPSGNGTWCDDSYTFHVSIPQAPRAFDVIAPDNNAVVSSPNVEFSWESTTDPDPNDSLVYVLQWSWHPTFSGALNITTEDTTAIVGPDSLPDNTTVYWRVKAVDRFGLYRWGGVLSGYTFRTDFPDVPSVFELTTPSAGGYMNRDSLALSWTESVDPDSYDVPCYDVWIDTNAAMSTAWLVGDSVRMTTFMLSVSDVFPGLDHYWTVRATDSNTSGTWASDTLLLHVSSDAGQPPAWSGMPETFGIPATYPNPFNSSMTAIVGLPRRSDIYVAVYDVLGRKVAVLASGRYDAGYHKFGLQADRLASGVYFVQARGSGFGTQLKKIVLVR